MDENQPINQLLQPQAQEQVMTPMVQPAVIAQPAPVVEPPVEAQSQMIVAPPITGANTLAPNIVSAIVKPIAQAESLPISTRTQAVDAYTKAQNQIAEQNAQAIEVASATEAKRQELQNKLIAAGLSPEKSALVAQKQIQPTEAVVPGPSAVDFETAFPKATEPTEEEVEAKVQSVLQPMKEQKLAETSAKMVQETLDAEKEKAEADKKAVEERMQMLDNRVRQRSLNEIMTKGTIGDKLLAAFSLALGGVAQGLTGQKENPVLAYMNQVIEQQAKQDDLSLEEKKMLQSQLYQQASLKLQELENKSQDNYRKGQLRLEAQKLQAMSDSARAEALQKVQQAASTQNLYSGKAITPEQFAQLTPEQHERVVTNPANGKKYFVPSKKGFEDIGTAVTTADMALKNLKVLEDLVKATPQTLKFTNPKKYYENLKVAQSASQAIAGALRIQYFGPGVFTKEEREQLIDMIGKPVESWFFRDLEMKKLSRTRDDIQNNIENTARTYGITERMYPDTMFFNIGNRAYTKDQFLKMYRQDPRYSNLSDDQIINAARKKGLAR